MSKGYDYIMENADIRHELYEKAEEAKSNAYAPFSNFHVGAALLTEDGSIYTGANIENSSFGATICAERVAMPQAIYDGKRDFVAIAVAADEADTLPCGICRQFMVEFCREDFAIITGPDTVFKLSDIIPYSFKL